jgi:hypothetical protein
VHRAHQEIAGAVAGEHAAGTIGAVSGGRQTEDEHTRARIAKSWNGFAPVRVETMSSLLIAGDAFAVRSQAGAARAGFNLTAYERQGES